MDALSNVPETIVSELPISDGLEQIPWKPEFRFSISKQCLNCGKSFHPRVYTTTERNGRQVRTRLMRRVQWNAAKYCCIRCAKLHSNAAGTPEVRKKISEHHKAMGYRPKIRGGNGCETPAPVASLLLILGQDWELEFPIPTMIKKGNGYPTCYKVDIGNPIIMTAIEVDGSSHVGERKRQDRKKDELLRLLGWRVFRITNTRAEYLSTICKSADILLSLLLESSSITAT